MPRNVAVSSASLSGLIALLESPLAALVVGALVAGKVYDLQTLCGSPDPGDPGLTDADFAAASDYFNVVAVGQAGLKINQWVDHMLWPLMCNCTDGTVPPASTTAPLPAVGLNPGLPGGVNGPTCWDQNATIAQNGQFRWSWNRLFPLNGDMPGWSGPGPAPQRLPTPLPTSVYWTGTRHSTGGSLAHWNATMQFHDAAGALIGAYSQFIGDTPPETVVTFGGAVPTNGAYCDVWMNTINTTSFQTDLAQGHIQLFCGGNTPSSPQVPCCPPDPSLDARLYRIEQYEQIIIKLLGTAFVSHVDGTRHSGLTGSGSIVLVDSVDAVRVEITSSLDGWPSNPGVPTYYFSLGFITSIAAESPLKGWRLVYGSQTFPIVSYADQIGYTLPPGVSIDLVELLPSRT